MASRPRPRLRAGALIAPGDPLVANRPRMVADLALKYRLPTMMDIKEFAEAGGLLSLGPDLVDSYRRAATHVDKILKGINLKTSRALGLTIPPSLLQRADQVIE